ncbi:MAG: hypothetical protein GY927_04505 [bacterium]|nr:hypothetical protein [bacterium]
MPDGSEYSFSRQSDGGVIATNLDANQVPYQVAFDGPWPADLRDISENPVKWWITDPEGRKFHHQSFKQYSSNSLYLVARPIDIIEPAAASHSDLQATDFRKNQMATCNRSVNRAREGS